MMMPVRRSMRLNRKVRTVYKAVEKDHVILEEKTKNCDIKHLLEIADEEENNERVIKLERTFLKEANLLVVKVKRQPGRRVYNWPLNIFTIFREN